MSIRIPPIPEEGNKVDPEGNQWDPWARLKLTEQFSQITGTQISLNPIMSYLQKLEAEGEDLAEVDLFQEVLIVAMMKGQLALELVAQLQPELTDLTLEEVIEMQEPLVDPVEDFREAMMSTAAIEG